MAKFEGDDDEVSACGSADSSYMDTTIGSNGRSGSTAASSSSSENVEILCELVGARNLPKSSHDEALRPYCVVTSGDDRRPIHASGKADDEHPIWTVKTKSVFLLSGDSLRRDLTVSVCAERVAADWLGVSGGTASFGRVRLSWGQILEHCDSERLELPLETHDVIPEEDAQVPTLALRFRLATSSDLELYQRLLDHPETSSEYLFRHTQNPRPLAKLVTEQPTTEAAQTSLVTAFKSVFKAQQMHDKQTGLSKVRVKPYPDPSNAAATKFLTSAELQHLTKQPSTNWTEAGSGNIGTLNLEILSCHDLPNVDVGEAVGNFTDPFVCAVYEDACAMTDPIDDELSPHWLPWTQRAFRFKMQSLTSQLFLGVFDCDWAEHEPIGRVAVNLGQLKPNMIYTLHYNLYPSANVTDRVTDFGSIVVRLSMECHDAKAALLQVPRGPLRTHINVKTQPSFRVVRYTCFGEHDNEEKFDLTVTKSYINEIFEYKTMITYSISDALHSLMMWRGQVAFCGGAIWLPIHSMIFFMAATTFVERPHLVVPFTLLGISWILQANLSSRRHHPSPWQQGPGFTHFLKILWFGSAPVPAKGIAKYQGNEKAKAYEANWAKRLDNDRRVAQTKADLRMAMDAIGDEKISTKSDNGGALSLELINRLGRYQGIIGSVCRSCRRIKAVLLWEENIVAFWISAGFLAAGLVSLLLPWAFLLRWGSRFFVWGCFGPQNKLLDLIWLQMKENADDNDATLKELVQNFRKQSTAARVRREEAMKLKDIRSIAFGAYSVEVPIFNLARHYDRPLPTSFAMRAPTSPALRKSELSSEEHRPLVVHVPDQVSTSSSIPYIPGQKLHGTMLPKPDDYSDESEEEEYQAKLDALRARAAPRDETPDEVEAIDQRSMVSTLPSKKSTVNKRSLPAKRSSHEPKRKYTPSPLPPPTQNPQEPSGESEGFEVIGCGRLSTLIESTNLACADVDNMQIQRCESSLSQAFQESDRVQVCFFRPGGGCSS